MTNDKTSFKNFEEFWPYYLSEHSLRGTRLVHVLGTLLSIYAAIKAIVFFSPAWLFLAPIIGYSLAYLSHVLIEKNQPATLTYPLWSFKGDLKMTWLWVTGRLEIELVRHASDHQT